MTPWIAVASVRALMTKVGIAPRLGGGADLLDALLGRDHFLAGKVPAALGPDLVLDHQPGDAGALEALHREIDVDRVAVAGVAVGLERDRAARRERRRGVQILLVAHDAVIGPAEMALAEPGAGDAGGLEAHRLDEAHAEPVIDAGHDHDFGCVDEVAKLLAGAGHVSSWIDAASMHRRKRGVKLQASMPGSMISPQTQRALKKLGISSKDGVNSRSSV